MGERIIDELLRGLADLCASLEESFKQFREKVTTLALEATAWKTLLAPFLLIPPTLLDSILQQGWNQSAELHWISL